MVGELVKIVKIRIYISFVLLFILTGCNNSLEQDSLRAVSEGSLIGKMGQNETFSWKGIPFAAAPIGDLRWKAPQPVESWSGIFEASEFKSACFQGSSGIQGDSNEKWSGDEDCLYLNIWTPRFTQDEIINLRDKLPVMMWIHGGGNTVGSAHVYDPSLLVSTHDVIVVTIHYRMGSLGWFRHPALHNLNASKEDKSGNYGTLDTIKALKWIQENIQIEPLNSKI